MKKALPFFCFSEGASDRSKTGSYWPDSPDNMTWYAIVSAVWTLIYGDNT